MIDWQFTNANASSTIPCTFDSMRSLIRKMKPMKQVVVVGTHALKHELELFLQADYLPESISHDRLYGIPCEFYDTEPEAFQAMMKHREAGREVLYCGDGKKIVKIGPATVSAMVNGQWQEIGKCLEQPIVVPTRESGMSRNQWKRLQKKLALAQCYAEKIRMRNPSRSVAAERLRILKRWQIDDVSWNMSMHVDHIPDTIMMYSPKLIPMASIIY